MFTGGRFVLMLAPSQWQVSWTMVKRWLPWLIKGGVSALAIWWVMRKVDFAGAWSQAKAIEPWTLLVATLLMLVQIMLGAVRWGMVLRALGGHFSAIRTAAVYYMGVFFTLVTTMGGDAMRMWFSRRGGLSLTAAVNSVMLERGVTVLGLVVLVVITEPLLLARAPDIPGAWVFPALLVVCIVGILVLSVLDRLPAALSRWRLVRGLGHLAGDTRTLFFTPSWSIGTLTVAVIGHVNLAVSLWVLAKGLGLPVGLIDCLVLFPPVILITTLPISIGGLGVRETAMATVFGFIGVAHDSAVLLSLVFFATSVATALPGGLVFLLSAEYRTPPEVLDVEKAEA